METFSKYLAVAVGGAFGASARYALNLLFARSFAPFPSATFFINVTGSFLIGFLLVVLTEKFDAGENLRLFLTIGFLGAYTTFSTFEFETLMLVRDKQLPMAIFYASMSFAVGLIGAGAGVWLAKKI